MPYVLLKVTKALRRILEKYAYIDTEVWLCLYGIFLMERRLFLERGALWCDYKITLISPNSVSILLQEPKPLCHYDKTVMPINVDHKCRITMWQTRFANATRPLSWKLFSRHKFLCRFCLLTSRSYCSTSWMSALQKITYHHNRVTQVYPLNTVILKTEVRFNALSFRS